tara:strand:- start:487 stop:1053 length:567 start_codon:yes stop_codon:yes gene_type:complete
MYSKKGLHVDNFNRFNLKELEEKFEEFSLTLRKKSYKDRKIIHVGLVNQLINFFKLEYPNLNRLPLKDLLSFLIEVDIKNKDLYHTENETNKKPKFSRKKKADTLIVAGLEILVENGYNEKDAIFKAKTIIKPKNDIYFYKLLNLYRSNLVNPNIKKLLKELKNEAKKRANIEDAATIYFEKASENIK